MEPGRGAATGIVETVILVAWLCDLAGVECRCEADFSHRRRMNWGEHVKPHVALVMPAFNEQDGIVGFLDELSEALSPLTCMLDVVVVDDHSTDDMPARLDEYAAAHDHVHIVHAEQNRGHGPTALRAYRTGLECDPDYIVFVDGDGQFIGEDVARALKLAEAVDCDVVHGVRKGRTDPWYRMALTKALGGVVALAAGGHVPDVNTPLRVYKANVVRWLLTLIPQDAEVPHVHFSLAETRAHLRRASLPVRSIPRRGATEQGSMWGGKAVPKLPPARLRSFVCSASGELWQYSLKPGSSQRTRSHAGSGLVNGHSS